MNIPAIFAWCFYVLCVGIILVAVWTSPMSGHFTFQGHLAATGCIMLAALLVGVFSYQVQKGNL